MEIFWRTFGILLCIGVACFAIATLYYFIGIARYFWILFRLNQKMVEAFQGRCTPMRVKLSPFDKHKDQWNHPEAVQEATDSLKKLSFDWVGDYRVFSNGYVQIRFFMHYNTGVIAVVYDMSGVHSGVDFINYRDGTSWTFSTRWDPRSPIPPWCTLLFYPDLDIPSAWQRLLDERPEAEMDFIPREALVEAFEKGYAREMDWVARRGGYTDDELREMTLAPNGHFTIPILNRVTWGREDVTDENIAELQKQWQEHFRNHFDNQLSESE